jgi:hypothetical protein
MIVDNLEQIENFMAASDEELIEMGADVDQIEPERKKLEAWYSKTNEELASILEIDVTESKYVRKSIERGKERAANNIQSDKSEKSGQLVTASGNLSRAMLSFSWSLTDTSYYLFPVEYRINISYNWNGYYQNNTFTDRIMVGWSHGLVPNGASGIAQYWNVDTGWITQPRFLNWYDNRTMTHGSTSAAGGYQFNIPQQISNNNALKPNPRNKQGSTTLRIAQRSKQNMDAQIIAKYYHKVIAVNSVSFTIPKGVSINIGTGWMTSDPQLSANRRV